MSSSDNHNTESQPKSLRSVLQGLMRTAQDASTSYPGYIRRCFITGKQCTNCDKVAAIYRQNVTDISSDNSIFVVMPFRSNLDTFYKWNLREFLINVFREVSIIDEQTLAQGWQNNIQRADQVSSIGYVMCERICRRIQEAALICVDISLINPNVFYELGLSVGLGKPLMVICDESELKKIQDELLEAVGLKKETVIPYPGINSPVDQIKFAWNKVQRIKLEKIEHKLDITPLCILENEYNISNENDIHFTFGAILRRAIEVSIDNVMGYREYINVPTYSPRSDLKNALEMIKGKKLQASEAVILVKGNKTSKEYHSYEHTGRAVNKSFCCVIDLGDENPISYFWLGYCHSRGINVVPISRTSIMTKRWDKKKETVTITQNDNEIPEAEIETKPVLAFDIRALWYIDYKAEKPEALADSLACVWEDLVVRDLTRLERNTFWEKLTRVPRISIYTGALHNEKYHREMVGDWDLRTVSELVKYLSSDEISIKPQLELPAYSPRTIYDKLGKSIPRNKFLKPYIDLIEDELSNKNCLIIATAESNPLTEVVLSFAYFNNCKNAFTYSLGSDTENLDHGSIIALKKSPPPESTSSASKDFGTFFCRDIGQPKYEKLINKIYRKSYANKNGEQGEQASAHNFDKLRGFLVDGKPIVRKYISQDEFTGPNISEPEDFTVLAHLLIMRNPFPRDRYGTSELKNQQMSNATYIVVLNGISGPGTLALAEIFTGAPDEPKKWKRSELILGKVNCLLEEINSIHYGIEALIEVPVTKPEQEEGMGAEKNPANTTERHQLVHKKSYDVRVVGAWGLWNPLEMEHITDGNPRFIPRVNYSSLE
jgi:hypothetical protein